MSDAQIPGLSAAEAADRLRTDGPNELPATKPKGNIRLVLDVLREPMFGLLLATGFIYFLLGSHEEAAALGGAIVVVIGITLYQQARTERTLEALRDLSSPRALVIRDGVRNRIPGKDVVCGDVLVLSEGDRVSADAHLLSVINLTVDESLLTGESVPVEKTVGAEKSELRPSGGENSAAVFSGTLVVRGTGIALVYATGARTEIGKLGRSLRTIQSESTNLERETKVVVRRVAMFSVLFCLLVALVYGFSKGNWLQAALTGLALAISLLPEELPVVLTIFLAIGAWRISRKHVLTRRIPAIEMLGAATVLCVDKTGTITMNRMSVRDVFVSSGHDRDEVLQCAMLASAVDPADPMEKALHEAAVKQPAVTFIREYPLSGGLLVMSRVVDVQKGIDEPYDVYAKGAPEAIGRLCRLDADQISPHAGAMAERGLRVLGVARGLISRTELPDAQEHFHLEFVGLVGLEDPIRPSVPQSIRECYRAGMRVVMITGDYQSTAESIAQQAGLSNPRASLTGLELSEMSPDELREQVRRVNVFARVRPEQKLKLVEAFKNNGDIVAMTGDGVNDAPALKAAHIGIAMGGRGTDVAREAASLVLLDDEFSSIVEAVRQGRRIYDNLKKAMTYIVAIHVPIAGISFLPVLFRLPLVLMPLHIVFLELVIDPACSVAFESEPEHSHIMDRPPRDPKSRIFDRRTVTSALLQGGWLLMVTVAAFLTSLYRGQGEADARAISFTTLVLGNLALIWANRSRSLTIPELLRSRNTALWAVTAGAMALLAFVLYVPWLRALFRFSILHPVDIAVCVLLAMISVTWFEAGKVWKRHSLQIATVIKPKNRIP